jgi:hypothetical protein
VRPLEPDSPTEHPAKDSEGECRLSQSADPRHWREAPLLGCVPRCFAIIVDSDRETGTGLYERRCRAKPRVDLAHEALGGCARCNKSSETAVIEVQKGKRIPVLGVWRRRGLVPQHEQPWYAVWSSLVVDRFLLFVPHGERTQALEHLAERRRDGPSQKEPLGLLSIRFEFVDAIAITRFPVLAAEIVG